MDDLELVHKCAQNEKTSWDKFLTKYSHLIYNYINSVLKQKHAGLFSQENINDIFQEILLSLAKDNFRKLKTFTAKNGCSLASWLRQVTINYTLDFSRKFRSTVSLDEDINDETAAKDLITDNSSSAEVTLNAEERIDQLKNCVEELDTDDKYFIEFHINRGISLDVMKDLFKVSRGAIDMRKSRIIGRLKDCFRNKGFISL